MTIEKFEKHLQPLGPTITVTLNYKEVRDITNALYHHAKDDRHPEILQDVKNIYAEMCVARDLVKHNAVQPDTAELIVATNLEAVTAGEKKHE